jgi:hypothetical protein
MTNPYSHTNWAATLTLLSFLLLTLLGTAVTHWALEKASNALQYFFKA